MPWVHLSWREEYSGGSKSYMPTQINANTAFRPEEAISYNLAAPTARSLQFEWSFSPDLQIRDACDMLPST